jgi:Icc protein
MLRSGWNSHRVVHEGGVVRAVQLTDAHLCQSRGGTLLGMDTDRSLQAVIDLVKRERPAIDLVLATGDLSDRGAREAYQRLPDYFGQLGAADFWLPGNHDERAQMEAVVAGTPRLSDEILVSRWQILMLDSQVPGEVGGCLGCEELARLDEALQRAREADLHSLVCLHHHPVVTGCDWLDQQIVADADAFFGVLDRYDGVRGVLWGHIHQQVERDRQGVALLGSPSTCVQFAPGSADFLADDLPPGYRWLDLHPDGTLESGVSRAWGVPFAVNLEACGYL